MIPVTITITLAAPIMSTRNLYRFLSDLFDVVEEDEGAMISLPTPDTIHITAQIDEDLYGGEDTLTIEEALKDLDDYAHCSFEGCTFTYHLDEGEEGNSLHNT